MSTGLQRRISGHGFKFFCSYTQKYSIHLSLSRNHFMFHDVINPSHSVQWVITFLHLNNSYFPFKTWSSWWLWNCVSFFIPTSLRTNKVKHLFMWSLYICCLCIFKLNSFLLVFVASMRLFCSVKETRSLRPIRNSTITDTLHSVGKSFLFPCVSSSFHLRQRTQELSYSPAFFKII